MSIHNLMTIKTNVMGAISIAFLSSILTVLINDWIDDQGSELNPADQIIFSLAGTPDILNCDKGVYSPVQRRCVDQAVFDTEMKQLYSALGLDASVFDGVNNENGSD